MPVFLAVAFTYVVLFYPATVLLFEAFGSHFSRLSYEKQRGHLLYGCLLVVIAALAYIVGLSILSAVMPGDKVAVATIGSGISFVGVTLYRVGKRRKKPRWKFYLAALVFVSAGTAMLVLGL